MIEEEGWVTLAEFLNSNPKVAQMMRYIEWLAICAETRRTVEVTARKNRAHARRRRRGK